MPSEQEIREAVADLLEVTAADLQPQTNLSDLPNFDSVQLLSLIVVLDELGVEVPPNKIADLRTFGDILRYAA
jgi:acyl carrier protein